MSRFFFFFNDTATTEIYTLSLHDALPTSCRGSSAISCSKHTGASAASTTAAPPRRSEEHTSELQSRRDLVCRLLLEKKKKNKLKVAIKQKKKKKKNKIKKQVN